MKFKPEQPTESGYYWVIVGGDMLIVYVDIDKQNVRSFYGYNDLDDKYVVRCFDWGDKIQEPTRD
jgi:hypothetical protein